MRFRKLLTVLAVALLVCALLSACAVGTTPTPSPTPNDTDTQPNTDTQPDNGTNTPIQDITTMYLLIQNNKIPVTLADNAAVKALVKQLQQGDIVYTASDYGGFEKVGALGYSLPTTDQQITTQAGDVMLYMGNQIVLFYGRNSWSYTRLGRIEGYSTTDLRTLLAAGQGDVTITITLR